MPRGRLGWVSQAGWAAGEVDSFHFRSGVRQGSPEKGHTEAGGGQGGLFGRDEPLSQVEVGGGGIGEGRGGPCGLKGEETAERKAQRDDAVKCVCGARNKAGGIRGAPGTKP